MPKPSSATIYQMICKQWSHARDQFTNRTRVVKEDSFGKFSLSQPAENAPHMTQQTKSKISPLHISDNESNITFILQPPPPIFSNFKFSNTSHLVSSLSLSLSHADFKGSRRTKTICCWIIIIDIKGFAGKDQLLKLLYCQTEVKYGRALNTKLDTEDFRFSVRRREELNEKGARREGRNTASRVLVNAEVRWWVSRG